MVNPHLPQPATLRCLDIKIEPELVTIAVESLAPSGVCPLCARRSAREHSRYTRNLGDLPWQGRSVRLLLYSRKFFCDSPVCSRRIFAERLPGVARAYARNTDRLADTFASIAFACGGEAGSRLARQLGMPISPDTLLRTIRRTHIPVASTFRILGVDDWAMRKGLRYGTLICDHEQRRPIDVLDDREPETLAAWLREHPEGCYNAAQLFRELEAIGFAGSYCSVRRRVAHWDRSYGSSTTTQPPNVQPPSARRSARLLLKNPADLDKRDRAFVDALLERCSEIRLATRLAREFAAMVRGEGGETLDSWIQRAWDPTVPREIRTFATSLKSDFDAVNAGLTTVWSNGLLEGQVNRLKLIKRQMYGRANFDLLRKRVLYTG